MGISSTSIFSLMRLCKNPTFVIPAPSRHSCEGDCAKIHYSSFLRKRLCKNSTFVIPAPPCHSCERGCAKIQHLSFLHHPVIPAKAGIQQNTQTGKGFPQITQPGEGFLHSLESRNPVNHTNLHGFSTGNATW